MRQAKRNALDASCLIPASTAYSHLLESTRINTIDNGDYGSPSYVAEFTRLDPRRRYVLMISISDMQ